MSTEQELIALETRIAEVEDRLKFLYTHMRIEYVKDSGAANSQVIELVRSGKKIEAIKVYRETYGVGLAEAKKAVDGMEANLGL